LLARLFSILYNLGNDMITSHDIGSPAHKADFLKATKQDAQENIWKNEMHLSRLTDERNLLQQELDKLEEALKAKGKPAANEEKKQQFRLEQNIKHQDEQIARVESDKKYNSYLLNDLIPRYEKQSP
jgi:hypothetical protein